jgi:hypothetical protein
LVHKDLKKRLNFVEIIKAHPFFSDVNWTDAVEKLTSPPIKPVQSLIPCGEQRKGKERGGKKHRLIITVILLNLSPFVVYDI